MNKVIAGSFLLLAATAAHAADNGLYLGASVGSAKTSVSRDTARGLANDFDGTDAAYKVILGLRPLDWLGAELNYVDLGKPDSGSSNADTTGVAGYAVGFASVGPVVDLFAKGGLVKWDAKISEGGRRLFSRDGTDLAVGAGVIVHLLSLSVRAEYEHFEIDERANLLSLGVTWTFL